MGRGVVRASARTVLDELSADVAAAVLCLLCAVPDARIVATMIYRRLARSVDALYIANGDLREVFVVLDSLAAYDLNAVRAHWLAPAIRRLTTCEQQPGGPYLDTTGLVRPVANRAVRSFLLRFEVVLPQLDIYADAVVDEPPALTPIVARVTHLASQLAAAHAALATRDSSLGVLHTAILDMTKTRVQSLPTPLNNIGLEVWDDMRRADRNHEIVLLPQMVARQLYDQSHATDEQLQLLGAANFFCWIATVLYDDFIDEEGSPERLPISNVCYRASLDLYRQALRGHDSLYAYVEHMYDLVDRANTWEVMCTRARVTARNVYLRTLPDYGDRMVLADRACGHIVGAMLLVQQVPGITPQQLRTAEDALKHYLIARQLNDDIHDWRKDLRAGQLSAVVVELLHATGIKSGAHTFATLVPQLEAYMFAGGLVKLYERLTQHVASSRQALRGSNLFIMDGALTGLLDNLQASAEAALRIRASEEVFLQQYQQLVS